MEDDAEDALRDLAGELDMTRNDTIRFIVREWMETNTYLPVHELVKTAMWMGRHAQDSGISPKHHGSGFA
ncbi:hypothetical protein GGE48_005674 [Rhizobium leguminosarum]|nr:hypothetical protein [Rhizobium leguminosarum]